MATPTSFPAKTYESVGSSEPSGETIGGHYNPTESWMVWTNRGYWPHGADRGLKQALRILRRKLDTQFGYKYE